MSEPFATTNYLDWDDPIVTQDPKFHGIVWMPTSKLRWETHHDDIGELTRILQQIWQTNMVNQSGTLIYIVNPYLSEWRDIPSVPFVPPPDG